MRRALRPADHALRALARTPGLVFTWWAAALPLLMASYGLVHRALDHGLPSQAGDLLLLLLWSCLVVVGWAWYLLGIIFLHQQALASARGEPVPGRPSLSHLLDLFPATAAAHAARTGLSLLALVPLGTALPLARVITAPWPVRAALGLPRSAPRPASAPPLGVVATQILAWVLLGLVTANLVVLAGWVTHGSLLDAPSLLPQLSDPRLWAVAGLLSLSLVEPWRALAMILALQLDHPPPPQAPPC